MMLLYDHINLKVWYWGCWELSLREVWIMNCNGWVRKSNCRGRIILHNLQYFVMNWNHDLDWHICVLRGNLCWLWNILYSYSYSFWLTLWFKHMTQMSVKYNFNKSSGKQHILSGFKVRWNVGLASERGQEFHLGPTTPILRDNSRAFHQLK